MPTDAELFVAHLQSIFGEEDAIHKGDATDNLPPVCVFVYRDVPAEGMITGVTYGLSLCDYPTWKRARPEMIVSVNSALLAWPVSAAVMANGFRGQKPFSYGDIFSTDVPLAGDSTMTAFLVFAQSILDDDVASVQLANYKIHFSQFYPIYQQEIGIYERIGLEAFWKHKDFDMYDIARPPMRE